MAPIYESDLAEERYAQTAWDNYELWEKIEIRLRRQRRLWIAGTVALFLVLSAIPIVRERSPSWRALSASRELALIIGQLKKESATGGGALRLTFADSGALDYRVERVSDCRVLEGATLRSGQLLRGHDQHGIARVSSERARELGIPGVMDSFCFDALRGQVFGGVPAEAPEAGIVFAPVKDLADGREDRFAVLLLRGSSAEISFD